MTDFYAYFELTSTITARCGGVSQADAAARMPEPFALLERLLTSPSPYPSAGPVEVQLIDLIPHFQAEEFATHAFMHDPRLNPPGLYRPPTAEPPASPSGMQYLWTVESRLFVRCGHIVSAPSRALAASRTAEMLERIAEQGFAAITMDDAAFARVEPLSVQPWVPAPLAHRLEAVAA